METNNVSWLKGLVTMLALAGLTACSDDINTEVPATELCLTVNGGHILYYRYDPTEKAGNFNEQGFWDFKKHTLDGRTYYSYHAPDYAFPTPLIPPIVA